MKHTDLEYEADLEKISNLVSHMSGQLEDILTGAERALRDRNAGMAQLMIEADRRINRTELAVDGLCMQVLALRQPVASDLRFVMTVLKMVTDFERIGDLAKNICERVTEVASAPRKVSDGKLLAMMGHGRETVRNAVGAFIGRDTTAARAVVQNDDRIDILYRECLQELLEQMKDEPATIFEATRLQSIAKYIERIGDHATNVAEMVVFMVEGQDIRHPRSRAESVVLR